MNKILLSALLSLALLSNSFSQITLTPATTNATCNGLCDGSITVTPVGGLAPFSYLWSNGSTTQNQTNLCQGVYSVTVNDVQLLSVSQSFTITEPTAINIVLQGFNASCPTSADGSIVTSVVGGSPPYAYSWSNVSTVQSPSNLSAGTYSLTVVDVNNCTANSSATVGSLSNLTALFNPSNPTCGLADGSISVNATGGLLPLTYKLGGGAPQSSNTFAGLSEGNYTVVVTDSAGCVVDLLVDLSQVKLFIDKVIPANCNNQNGEIRMKATGGTLPYTFAWSIGGGNTSIADSLVTGGYSVTVTDSAGCSIHKNILVPFENNCIGKLSGKVFYDLNGDCKLDSNEAPLQYAKIQVSGNGAFYVLSSDIKGYYQAILPLGTYIIEPFGTTQNITCPASLKYQVNLVQAGVIIDGNDFAVKTVAYSDVYVTGTTSIARPGFKSDVWVTVINNSTIYGVSTGQAKLTLDAKTNAIVASDTGVISGKVVTWNYYLNQGEQKSFHLNTQIIAPPIVNIGDVLMYEAKVIPATADSFSNNNIDSLGRVVQGSYDPNDKAVFPNGNILIKDTVLKYTIRFQNTGNDTAFTVIVRDTLDTNLNPYTFRNFTSSHSMTPVFVANNVIEFRFDQINLPDSFVNEPASNGFVTFVINRFKNIPIGSTVKNQVAIYFDYNLPIFTNTIVNTIVNPVSSIQEFSNAAIKIYPNPVNEKLFIVVEDNQFQNAILYDLNGAKVAENTLPELSVAGLPHGMYVCKVALKNTAVYYTKIIVE